MKTYTVRLNGYPVKDFNSMEEAQKFMIQIHLDNQDKAKALDYIDEAVLQSNMSEAMQVINRVMEIR